MAPYRVPPPGLFHHGVPSFCSRPWCPATLPPHRRVLCQVLACRWHEGLKCAPADQLLVARLHVLLRRPGDTRSRSRPTSPTASPWAAQWACGSSQSESTNNLLLHLHKVPKRSHYFVRSTNIRTFDSTVTRHSAATPPRKGRVASVSPDTPRMKKLYTYLYPSHLCLSRVLTLSPILASDRRPLRRARSLCSWFLTPGPGSRGTGQLCIVCHQAGRTNRTHRTHPDS